jgi:hypothetical protein
MCVGMNTKKMKGYTVMAFETGLKIPNSTVRGGRGETM